MATSRLLSKLFSVTPQLLVTSGVVYAAYNETKKQDAYHQHMLQKGFHVENGMSRTVYNPAGVYHSFNTYHGAFWVKPAADGTKVVVPYDQTYKHRPD